MTLTEDEQKICDYYSQRFVSGRVGCNRCPLVISKRDCLCKANCTEEEWEERIDNDSV